MSATQATSVSPETPWRPHNSSALPRNPSPGGRVKSHCLRPRPPPDPAPARPLPGIWWGAGAASSLGTDPEARLFTSPPGRRSRTCRRPLCCPPRPPGRTAAPLARRSRTAPSGRPPSPPQALAFPGLPGLGSSWKGGGGGRGEGPRDCVPERHEARAPAPGS